MNPSDLPPVLTVAEAAEFLRVNKKLIYRLVRSGEIECLRLGSSIRIPRHAIEVMLEPTTEPHATPNLRVV